MNIETVERANIRYALVSKDERQVSIQVKYWVDGYDFFLTYSIDLPINTEFKVPSGKELQMLILEHAPVGQLQDYLNRYKSAVMVDMEDIDRLIELHKDQPGHL